jgi:hypothetical protein
MEFFDLKYCDAPRRKCTPPSWRPPASILDLDDRRIDGQAEIGFLGAFTGPDRPQ